LLPDLAALAFGHITFTTEKKIIDVGPITATSEERHTVPIPDIAEFRR